jgi:predicted permease
MTLGKDLRQGWRLLCAQPGFTIAAAASVAIAIAANATVFSFADALLLRGLPAAEPQRLVRLHATWGDGTSYHSFSYPTYRDLERESRTVLSGLAAEYTTVASVGSGAEGTSALIGVVSSSYFETLGVKPALGRFFDADEAAAPGSNPVLVLGSRSWQRNFGSDPGVLGRQLRVNGHSYEIVGVAPEGFTGTFGPVAMHAFLPLSMMEQLNPGTTVLRDRAALGLELIGRLRDGVELDAASAGLRGVMAGLIELHPEALQGQGVELLAARRLPGSMRGAVAGFMAMLLGLSALILAIACANVATMLLARATVRRREMAIRRVAGATRLRLARQMLVETSMLFGLACVAGLGLATVLTRTLVSLDLPFPLPLDLRIGIDPRAVAVSALVALGAGLVSGLVPAFSGSGRDPSPALKSSDPRAGRGAGRLRSGLVVAEMAMALLLVVVAGLFAQALSRAARLDPGFEHADVHLATLDLSTQGYGTEAARQLHLELRDRLADIPGIEAVALADMVPLALSNQVDLVSVAGVPPPAGQQGHWVDTMMVSPEYFGVVRIPLLAGRGFQSFDQPGGRNVAVINQAMARRFWPGERAVGRRFATESEGEIEVVGIARDASYRTLGEEPRPYFYRPFAQAYGNDAITLHLRTSSDVPTAMAGFRRALAEVDPELSATAMGPMSEVIALSLLPQRLAAALAGGLGGVGLLLAAVGLYGVMSYAVGRRTREMGVRLAVGACSADLQRGVLYRGAILGGAGIAVGLLLAAAVTRLLASRLYGVSPFDPLVLGGASLLFLLVALVASLVPARRAARTDPVLALRSE